MKSQNILLTLAFLIVGVILYKFLLGFVLPIALFVSLGYVLKFLLKGAVSDSELEASQVLTNGVPITAIENIVEIKPIEEDKSQEEEEKPNNENKSS